MKDLPDYYNYITKIKVCPCWKKAKTSETPM